MRTPGIPASPPAVTRRELAVLGLLAGLGLAGAFIASLQLARLRIDLDTARQERGREIARLQVENESLRHRENQRAMAAHLASAPGLTPPPYTAISREERMAGLLSLANTLRSGPNAGRARSEQMIAEMELRAARNPLRAHLPQNIAAYLLIENQPGPRFGELFMLPEAEVGRLRDALRIASDRTDALTAANTQIKDNGDGSYTLSMTALPESSIAAELAPLTETFRQILGDDGYEAFLRLNGAPVLTTPSQSYFGKLFNPIANQDRTVVIAKDPQGAYTYKMRYGEMGGANGTAPALNDLKSRLGGGIKLLPPQF